MFNEVFNHSKNNPNKIAIITENKKCSYLELVTLISNIEIKISSLKLKDTDIIAVENKNFFHFVAASIAIFRKGNICLPLTQDKDLSSYLIKESNAKYLLRSTKDGYNLKFKLKKINNYSYQKRFPKHIPIRKNNKPVILYPTSGTSGKRRKIVVQGKKALIFSTKYISKFMKLNSNLIEFIGSPPDNVFWYGRIRCCLGIGGTIILNHNSTNPIIALNEIKKNFCNAISADTSFHLMLLKFFKKRLSDLSNQIKWIKLSSQKIPEEDLKNLLSIFPKSQIIMGYGLTEAMRTTLISYRKNPKKINSVGTTQKGVKIKILNDNTNLNNSGQIIIKGDNLALGYLNSKIETEKKFIKKYFYTGDRGYLDKDDFLYFQSRLDSTINIGGLSYSPDEILSLIEKKMSKCNTIIVGIDGIDDILGTVPILLIENNVYSRNFLNNLILNKFNHKRQIMPKAAYSIKKFPRTKNGKILLSNLPKNLSQLENFKKIWSI